MCSIPCQSRLNRTTSGGLHKTAATRYQKPILRPDTRNILSWTLLTCWLAVVPCSRTSVAPGTPSVEDTVTPHLFGEPGSRSEWGPWEETEPL
ncbi:hypothetical protein SVIO_075660 [Streptomyces violaceusniger]|uniref:Uncharacterized protein n=1 Tax=Streptomyces violaceusniger TaxID=68280 RepID=A0A4D4LFR0_STRVO|nr:hypothetical protein SVIO_075660 [Streptomyces violaceusniger]